MEMRQPGPPLKIFQKNFLKNLVVPEILLNFADATDNKNGSEFFEKL